MPLSQHQKACLQAIGITIYRDRNSSRLPNYAWLSDMQHVLKDNIKMVQASEDDSVNYHKPSQTLYIPKVSAAEEPTLKKQIWTLVQR